MESDTEWCMDDTRNLPTPLPGEKVLAEKYSPFSSLHRPVILRPLKLFVHERSFFSSIFTAEDEQERGSKKTRDNNNYNGHHICHFQESKPL